MTDKEALFLYRIKQSEETILEAKKMLEGGFNPRTIVNRAYYSLFYAVLALFIKTGVNIKTSKHIGVISLFDKEFVLTNKIDKHYSKIFHKIFNIRQRSDYKEFVELSAKDATEFVNLASESLSGIKNFLQKL